MKQNQKRIPINIDRDTIRLLPPIRAHEPERRLDEINDQLRRELLDWQPQRIRRRNLIVSMVLTAAACVAFGGILYLINL